MESKKNEDTTEYRTKDLGEGAGILTKGAKLIRLEQEQNFFWFVFQDKQFCEQLSSSYWSGELKVSAKSYSDTLRSLKDRLFARR